MLKALSPMPALRLPALDRKHVMSTILLAVVAFLYLVAGISVTSLAGMPGGDGAAYAKETRKLSSADPRLQAPPAPEPLKFRQIPKDDAVAYNASIPLSTTPNPAAKAFVFGASSEHDRLRAIECLTAAVYYEAAVEGVEGQRAVAQVVLNRVRHPAYPRSVCGVVFEGSERATGCQFTFTCDGALARAPHPALWQRAREVAEQALAGKVYAPVGWATHYHTNWVVPYWSSSLVKAANVGTHIFYRWEGGWGTAPAFRHRHSGAEPQIARMKHLSAVPQMEDEAAEAAALAAAAAGSEILPDGTIVPAPAADMLQRPVVRRYEPAKRESLADMAAGLGKSGGSTDSSVQWALTGSSAAKPLGRKPAAASEAKPEEPIALAGVRRQTAPKGAPACDAKTVTDQGLPSC